MSSNKVGTIYINFIKIVLRFDVYNAA